MEIVPSPTKQSNATRFFLVLLLAAINTLIGCGLLVMTAFFGLFIIGPVVHAEYVSSSAVRIEEESSTYTFVLKYAFFSFEKYLP